MILTNWGTQAFLLSTLCCYQTDLVLSQHKTGRQTVRLLILQYYSALSALSRLSVIFLSQSVLGQLRSKTCRVLFFSSVIRQSNNLAFKYLFQRQYIKSKLYYLSNTGNISSINCSTYHLNEVCLHTSSINLTIFKINNKYTVTSRVSCKYVCTSLFYYKYARPD